MSQEKELQALLHEDIPLTQAIGIQVEKFDGDSLKLCAPLSNNLNHKCTAFGGSLYAVAVLSGWGLLHLKLAELGLHGHIVIQESQVKYLKPVTEDIRAVATIAEGQNFERVVKLFKRKGRARLEICSEVMQGDEVAMTFQGSYVVHN
jgi:thioesterase domain-containing protein